MLVVMSHMDNLRGVCVCVCVERGRFGEGGWANYSPKGQIPPATCFVVVLICMQKSLI